MRTRNVLAGRIVRIAVLSLPLWFLAIFFFYPLGAILWRAFSLAQSLIQSDWAYLGRVIWFSTWQAALSTLLTLLLGLPGAHVFARYRFPGKTLLQALTTIPFVMPALIVASAILSLLGPNGLVNAALMRFLALEQPPLDIQHTIWIILLAHVFYNYSVVVRIVGSFWALLDPQLEEAARVLGANRWQAWVRVALPQLLPTISAAALLTFTFCFSSFGVMIVLGGPRFANLEVEIYRQAAHMLDLPLAAALSIVQLIITFALMSAYTALQRRTTRPQSYRSRAVTQSSPGTWPSRLWTFANVLVMVALLVTPLVALLWRSLTLGNGVSLRYYYALTQDPGRSVFFATPLTAIRNSLLFAAFAVLISLALGTLGAYLVARQRSVAHRWVAWLDPVLALPLGASAVTLGFGYLVGFSRSQINWIASPAMVPIAHALIAFPFVLRSVLPALRGIRPSLREAAATLGSPPGRVWWHVDLPLIARPLAVGAVFAFTISIGEFGATLLIARTEYATIPVVLYRYLAQPGLVNLGQALAMSVILMAICAISFVVIERFRIGEVGAF
jgi:thiamine transport system permease protein